LYCLYFSLDHTCLQKRVKVLKSPCHWLLRKVVPDLAQFALKFPNTHHFSNAVIVIRHPNSCVFDWHFLACASDSADQLPILSTTYSSTYLYIFYSTSLAVDVLMLKILLVNF